MRSLLCRFIEYNLFIANWPLPNQIALEWKFIKYTLSHFKCQFHSHAAFKQFSPCFEIFYHIRFTMSLSFLFLYHASLFSVFFSLSLSYFFLFPCLLFCQSFHFPFWNPLCHFALLNVDSSSNCETREQISISNPVLYINLYACEIQTSVSYGLNSGTNICKNIYLLF